MLGRVLVCAVAIGEPRTSRHGPIDLALCHYTAVVDDADDGIAVITQETLSWRLPRA